MTLNKVLYRTRVHITGSWKKALMMHPLLRVVFISLLAAQATPNTVWAQVKAVPPLSGVIGKVQSVTDSSIDVQTGSGVVHVNIKQPFTTYKQIPSDLSHVASTSYIGVAGGWKRSSEADHHISRGTSWSCRRQCSDRSAGCNHSQQNDQWLRLSPCRIALAHDERHGAERQRYNLGGPISGRLQDDLRACKRRRHASRTRKSDTSCRRHDLLNNRQAAERNAFHGQDPCNRSSGVSQHQAVRVPANERFNTSRQ